MSIKKKNTEKLKLIEEQTEKLMLGVTFSSHALTDYMHVILTKSKLELSTCPRSPFSKEYVKIMQTLQDK